MYTILKTVSNIVDSVRREQHPVITQLPFYDKKVDAKSSALCLLLVFFFFFAAPELPEGSTPCILMRLSRGFDPSSDISLRRIIRCWPCMIWRNDDDALDLLPLLLTIARPVTLFGACLLVFGRLFLRDIPGDGEPRLPCSRWNRFCRLSCCTIKLRNSWACFSVLMLPALPAREIAPSPVLKDTAPPLGYANALLCNHLDLNGLAPPAP